MRIFIHYQSQGVNIYYCFILCFFLCFFCLFLDQDIVPDVVCSVCLLLNYSIRKTEFFPVSVIFHDIVGFFRVVQIQTCNLVHLFSGYSYGRQYEAIGRCERDDDSHYACQCFPLFCGFMFFR